jgi:hypothetical protein
MIWASAPLICHSFSTYVPVTVTWDTVLTKGFSDINALILDYLTMEGYPNAAANFSKEANLPPQQETSSIVARQEIQNLIHSGQVEMALKALNDYDPEVRSRLSTHCHSYMI